MALKAIFTIELTLIKRVQQSVIIILGAQENT